MKTTLLLAIAVLLFQSSAISVSVAAATPLPDEADSAESTAAAADQPQEHLVTTDHRIQIGGRDIRFQATVGKLILKNDQQDPRAEMFFVAYTKSDVPDPAARPITFCFNGGPGSSSVWLHLGMLGPKKIHFPDDASYLRPPYQLQNNPWSLLDVTDLVFIDPISTGYSRPTGETEGSEFHGYQEDIESVGQFIHDYTTRYLRWPSPRFLCGESYGGVRAAGLSAHLQSRYNMELNGIVVISGAINFQTLRFSTSNDLPNICFLPCFAATAWYHKALSPELQALPLESVVDQAAQFARGDYAQALLQGTSLATAERERIAAEVSRLTGLSQEFVLQSRLRVSMQRFGKELLRNRAQTIGRFDSRYRNRDRDDAGENYEFDASGAAIFGPFTATFNDYVRRDLQFEDPHVYEILTGAVQPWSYSSFENKYVDASESLRRAMTANPSLKVFAACGHYDLATPPASMDYTLDHLGLAEELIPNITRRYYAAGHMMYIHDPSHQQLRDDLLIFYRDAVPQVAR